jgi:hypothetical protein
MRVRAHETRHHDFVPEIDDFIVPSRFQMTGTVCDFSINDTDVAFIDGRRCKSNDVCILE